MSSIVDFIFRIETLWYLLVFFYVLVCVGLIFIVLIQKGKGAGFAGAFGIGPGSETVFGPRGSRSVPVRMTHILAACFMVFALTLSLLAGKVGKGEAPEEVAVDDAGMVDESGSTGLEDLGLGSAVGDAATAPAPEGGAIPTPEAPAAPAPVAPMVPDAPAPDATATPEPAPAAETPAPEAPAAPPTEGEAPAPSAG